MTTPSSVEATAADEPPPTIFRKRAIFGHCTYEVRQFTLRMHGHWRSDFDTTLAFADLAPENERRRRPHPMAWIGAGLLAIAAAAAAAIWAWPASEGVLQRWVFIAGLAGLVLVGWFRRLVTWHVWPLRSGATGVTIFAEPDDVEMAQLIAVLRERIVEPAPASGQPTLVARRRVLGWAQEAVLDTDRLAVRCDRIGSGDEVRLALEALSPRIDSERRLRHRVRVGLGLLAAAATLAALALRLDRWSDAGIAAAAAGALAIAFLATRPWRVTVHRVGERLGPMAIGLVDDGAGDDWRALVAALPERIGAARRRAGQAPESTQRLTLRGWTWRTTYELGPRALVVHGTHRIANRYRMDYPYAELSPTVSLYVQRSAWFQRGLTLAAVALIALALAGFVLRPDRQETALIVAAISGGLAAILIAATARPSRWHAIARVDGTVALYLLEREPEPVPVFVQALVTRIEAARAAADVRAGAHRAPTPPAATAPAAGSAAADGHGPDGRPTPSSVTAEPCRCEVLQGLIDGTDGPFRFDAELREYQVAWRDRDGTEHDGPIYHCLFCGGALPRSRRHLLFHVVDRQETTRLLALGAGLRTWDDVRARFGEPDQQHAMGMTERYPEREGLPPRSQASTLWIYQGLSPVADVHVYEWPNGMQVSVVGKPKETSNDQGASA